MFSNCELGVSSTTSIFSVTDVFLENIKLASVTYKDWSILYDRQGEFFLPDDRDTDTLLPEWFDPDNLVIRHQFWGKCPSEDRRDIFELFSGK